MDVKDFLFCAIVVLIVNYAAAQKKTTVTGGIEKNKGSGTRVDLGLSHKRGNWKFDGSGFGTSRGHRGGSLGVSHKRKNLEFGGSVFGDNRGNRGGRVGFKWRFRRSTQLTGEHFEVIVVVNQCDFNVYDKNEDGVITKEEMYDVFSKTLETERLFDALDSKTGDGQITLEEFTLMAPTVINGCSDIPADVVEYSV